MGQHLLLAAGAGGSQVPIEGLYKSLLYTNSPAGQTKRVETGVPVFSPDTPTISIPYTYASGSQYSYSASLSVQAGDFLIVFAQNLFRSDSTLEVNNGTSVQVVTAAARRQNAYNYSLAAWIYKFPTTTTGASYSLGNLDPGSIHVMLVRGATNATIQTPFTDYSGTTFTTASYASNGCGFLFASDRDAGLTATANNGTLLSALSINENYFSGRVWQINNVSGTVPATTVTWSGNMFNGDWIMVDFSSSDTSPGLIIFKERQTATGAYWIDTINGKNKYLDGSSTSGLQNGGLTSWDATGFTLPSAVLLNNSNGHTYGAHVFKKEKGFFTLLQYTGNGQNRTIPHDLGATPGMIIIKCTNFGGNWIVWHRTFTGGQFLVGHNESVLANDATVFNSTAPTASEFSLGTGQANANGYIYTAYIFGHDDEGKYPIFCGTYEGNGAFNNGPTVSLPWEAQTLITKNVDVTGTQSRFYLICDELGMSFGQTTVRPLLGSASIDITGNNSGVNNFVDGIKINDSGYLNLSNNTHIFMAIRSEEYLEPTTGSQVFQAIQYTSDNLDGRLVQTTIKPDGAIFRPRSVLTQTGFTISLTSRNMGDWFAGVGTVNATFDTDTLMDAYQVYANGTAYSHQDPYGIGVGNDSIYDLNYSTQLVNTWVWSRAKGFFDQRIHFSPAPNQVQTIKHRLGVAPDMIWIKGIRGTTSANTYVYASPLGPGETLLLNSAAAIAADSLTFNNTSPTATEMTFNRGESVAHYLVWFFASLPGISKIGTYIGNGGTQTVDCGFTTGPRFILIRALAGGNWMCFDTTRGIASPGADVFVPWEVSSGQTTTTDHIDISPAGFTAKNSTTTNTNGNVYLYYAIA